VICWINPCTGLAGDMLLGALLDAGAPLEAARGAVAATGLTGWELTCERTISHGLAAARVRVHVQDQAARRRAAELIAMASRVTPRPVADLAVAALTAIAEAEARLHGVSPAEVHLHELGGHDTLIDIVGTAAALHALGVIAVHCAPLPLGTGQVRTAHGILPSPAPATLALLEGAAVTGTSLPGETVTPTAAALLRAVATRYDPPPPMTLSGTGYGAGTRQLPDRPNVVSVALGIPASSPARTGAMTQSVEVLETNLDDVTGETLGYVIARALEAGALDAWVTPAVMKKGRPAHVLHVLTRPGDSPALQQLLFTETGTLGVRRTPLTRTALPRTFTTVDLDGVPVRVKHGPHGAKAEHDDLAAAAAALGLPLRLAAERAADAARGEPADQGDDEEGTS
jgi:pyridinium-3,5-bisthiocarboxylic acid mononucleotide nickel chelatase